MAIIQQENNKQVNSGFKLTKSEVETKFSLIPSLIFFPILKVVGLKARYFINTFQLVSKSHFFCKKGE
jgi:hypothetical protein